MKALSIVLVFLMLLGSLAATQVSIGYVFSDKQIADGRVVLGLGVSAIHGTALCGNSISFTANTPPSGSELMADYVEMHYQGILTPHVSCYKNYTCILNYFNGSYYKTVSSSDPLSVFQNMTNLSYPVMYTGQCVVYDKLGSNATTDLRYLSINGYPGTVYVNKTIINIVNITPGHINTVDVYSILFIIALILFIAASFASMRILGVFASLILILIGMMLITDGIVYPVGTIHGGDNTMITTNNSSIIGNVTYTNSTAITYMNTSTATTYAPMTVSGIDFADTLGLFMVLLAMFGMLYYGLGVGKYLNKGT